MSFRPIGSDSAAIISLTALYANVTAAGESNTIALIPGFNIYGVILNEYFDSAVEATDPTINGNAATEVSGDPAAGEFHVWKSGDKGNACIVECNSADAGTALVLKYNGTGTNLPKFVFWLDGLLKAVFPGEAEGSILKVDSNGEWNLGVDNTAPLTGVKTPSVSIGSATSFTIPVTSSAFSDYDGGGHTHAASRWVLVVSGGSPDNASDIVVDSGEDAVNLTSYNGFTRLLAGTNFDAYVKHKCSNGDWSNWSSAGNAATAAFPADFDLQGANTNFDGSTTSGWNPGTAGGASITADQSFNSEIVTAMTMADAIGAYATISRDIGTLSNKDDVCFEFRFYFDGGPVNNPPSSRVQFQIHNGTNFVKFRLANSALYDHDNTLIAASAGSIPYSEFVRLRVFVDMTTATITDMQVAQADESRFTSKLSSSFSGSAHADPDGQINITPYVANVSDWTGNMSFKLDAIKAGNSVT